MAGQELTRRAVFRVTYTPPSCVFYMTWFAAKGQLTSSSVPHPKLTIRAVFRDTDANKLKVVARNCQVLTAIFAYFLPAALEQI